MSNAQHIRNIRTNALQWTQERMAKEVGVSLRTYARFEQRGASPAIEKLIGFIALNHTATALAQESEPTPSHQPQSAHLASEGCPA